MKKLSKNFTISELAEISNSKLIKRNEEKVYTVSAIENSNENSLCFIADKKYLEKAKKSKANCFFFPENLDPKLLPNKNLIQVKQPYFEFMKIVKLFLAKKSINYEISEQSYIDPSAKIKDNVVIKPNSFIAENVEIDEHTIIDSSVTIQENVKIGKNCKIFSNATIYSDTIIGDNVTIHSSASIGSDGFGYFEHNKKQIKIPQIGNTIIENDVEIGSNTCVDRATLGSTVIGQGSKLDNLVQIGHNCVIGKNCILCAQVGLAGSTIVEDNVYLAGQVGAAGHITIGKDSKVGAQSGISKDVPENSLFFGTPAMNASDQKRIFAIQRKLLKNWKKIRKLFK